MRHDLSRFHDAQTDAHAGALSELRAGHKTGHWMWFEFPQLAGLGRSDLSRRYAIRSLDEARAYLADPVLRARLIEACDALLGHPDRTAESIMGGIDAVKLRSSMTLFLRADPAEPRFRRILERFYDGRPDPATDDLLATT
jgi:uncharacterized protein (DUF1810 family)